MRFTAEHIECARDIFIANLADTDLFTALQAVLEWSATPRRVVATVEQRRRPTVDAVARAFRLEVDDIMSRSRTRVDACARAVCCYLLRAEGMSLSDTGRALGGLHHASVLTAVAKVRSRVDLLMMADLARARQR